MDNVDEGIAIVVNYEPTMTISRELIGHHLSTSSAFFFLFVVSAVGLFVVVSALSMPRVNIPT